MAIKTRCTEVHGETGRSEHCIHGPVLDVAGGEATLRPSPEDVLDQLGCMYRVGLRRLHLQGVPIFDLHKVQGYVASPSRLANTT